MVCHTASKFDACNVILHAFDWRYLDVVEQAEKIASLGYGSVLVSPPMRSLKKAEGTKWWQRYQPQDYRVIDNQLGNTQHFALMVQTLAQHGVKTYVDVVFNHMANESDIRNDLTYPNQDVLNHYAQHPEHFSSLTLFGDLSQPLFQSSDFVDAFGIEDWTDKWQVQNGRITGGPKDPGLPTLQDNPHVVSQQRAYLKALRRLGVKGFRIDAAKHMTIEHLKKVWTEDITDGMHIFGEIITDGGATVEEYELFLEPYLSETRLGAYDFPLFKTLYQAFSKQGSFKSLIDPYCFGQALEYHRAITFVITHDIPNNDVFLDLVMDECSEWLAYAYIFGRDGGVPLVYTDLDTSGIRDKQGNPRWLQAWCDPRMATMIDFHNRCHGTPVQLMESNDDLLVFGRGDQGVVVINKSKRPQTISFSSQQRWQDLLSGQAFSGNEKGKVQFKVASQSAMMMVPKSAM